MPLSNAAYPQKSHVRPVKSDEIGRSLDRRELFILRAWLLLPWIGLVACAVFMSREALRPGLGGVVMLLVGYLIGGAGFEIGYHRLFGHRSFEASAVVRAALVIIGSTAAEGSIFRWAAIHRRHHEFSDHDGDPHSPRGSNWLQRIRGLWHAHMGWMWYETIGMTEYLRVTDLIQDPVLYRLGRVRMYYFWVAMGLILPAALGAWIWGGWTGAGRGFLWGGLLRLLLVQNRGFVVNSIGHAFGRKTFKTGDESRDNVWIALPTFGGGWQNTHHAFPSSWTNHILWWQFDPAGLVVRGLAAAGLIWDLKYPTAALIQHKLVAGRGS